MAKQYRLQASEHRGVVTRGWGYGRAVSWSPWRTVGSYTDRAEAEAMYERRSRVGLSRWRLVYGKEIVRNS